tara:strand:+ start:490 stop:822 length:333 start_codon:yes stop_codon:yes gene_type:complete
MLAATLKRGSLSRKLIILEVESTRPSCWRAGDGVKRKRTRVKRMRQKLPALTEKRGENYGREGKRDGEKRKERRESQNGNSARASVKGSKNVILFILRLLCVLAARLQGM